MTSTQLRRAADIKEELEALNKELASLVELSVPAAAKRLKKKGKMSAAAKPKIAVARNARWAKPHESRDLKKSPQENKKRRLRGEKRKMSAPAKAKISAAAKARWAKVKAAKPVVKQTKTAAKAPVKKRTMSAAAKAKISAAAKARWAKIKASGKKSL